MRSSSSSQRALSSSSSEGASRGSGARAAMSESVMRESAPPSRSRRRQPETAAAVTPASAARSAARSPASSRATSSIFLSKGKYTAFLRGGGATPAAFAQFTTAVRLQPASSAASVRLNPAATASTASSLVSNGYMRTPIRTPECPTFCPHTHMNEGHTKDARLPFRASRQSPIASICDLQQDAIGIAKAFCQRRPRWDRSLPRHLFRPRNASAPRSGMRHRLPPWTEGTHSADD